MTLYEIDEAILACVDEETGEVLDIDKLEALGLMREQKISSLACWMKDLGAEIEALRNEEKNLKARREAKERKKESLKAYLAQFLAGEKYEDERCRVSFRKVASVAIDNFDDIPAEYIRTKVETSADKEALKKLLKEGESVAGVHLEESLAMTVK